MPVVNDTFFSAVALAMVLKVNHFCSFFDDLCFCHSPAASSWQKSFVASLDVTDDPLITNERRRAVVGHLQNDVDLLLRFVQRDEAGFV